VAREFRQPKNQSEEVTETILIVKETAVLAQAEKSPVFPGR
jgi:hypothetical protein